MPVPVVFYNRHTRELETEVIYGEGFLRWAYEHPMGRSTTSLLVKRTLFSQWYGYRMNQASSRHKIPVFIKQYGIPVEEMAETPESFPHFNAFFSRKLKPEARPIAADERAVIFPADGRHFAIPDVSASDGIFVKGIRFDLAAFLGDAGLAERFGRGSMLISRLCPVDYHRFHFPCDGVPDAPRLINGVLFSVNPVALRQRPTLLWENKRYITRLASKDLGEVLLLEVGATCVGTVVHTNVPGKPVEKGDEKGFFLFGGSCFVSIYEAGRVTFSDDLLEHAAQRREVYARMGDVAAVMVCANNVSGN